MLYEEACHEEASHAIFSLCFFGCSAGSQQTAFESPVAAPSFAAPATQVDTICQGATNCWKQVLQGQKEALAAANDAYPPGEKREHRRDAIRSDTLQELRNCGGKAEHDFDQLEMLLITK